MKKAIIIGGSNGIGDEIIEYLETLNYEVDNFDMRERVGVNTFIINLKHKDALPLVLDKIENEKYDLLIYAAGIGELIESKDILSNTIKNELIINSVEPAKLFTKIFDTSITSVLYISSVSSELVSPMFASYSASKSYTSKFIETINYENKINNVDLTITDAHLFNVSGTGMGDSLGISKEDKRRIHKMVDAAIKKELQYFEEDFTEVKSREQKDTLEFAEKSFANKKDRKIGSRKKSVGYLTGSFDTLHYGHLRLIKRAKQQCDELWVGIHRDGERKGTKFAHSFANRKDFLNSISEIDYIVETSGSDASDHNFVKYDKLFVGDDYKGTERFKIFEKQLSGKAEIIYFTRTKGVSSSQMRELLKDSSN